VKKVFLALLIICACTETKQEPPENLLSEAQMVAFLIDTHMLEGQRQAARVSKDTTAHIYREFEVELYEKHQIDSQQFIDSYHYYLANVEQLSDIYDAVIDSLSLREKVLINQKD